MSISREKIKEMLIASLLFFFYMVDPARIELASPHCK